MGHVDRDLHIWLEGEHLVTLSQQGDDGWYLRKPTQKDGEGVFIGFSAALRLMAQAATEAADLQDKDDAASKNGNHVGGAR